MLYILHEKFYSETSIKIKSLINATKKLTQRKIRILELDSVDAVYSILKEDEAILFIPYGIEDRHKQLVVDCNECGIPVILANNYFGEFYNFYCSMIMGNMNYSTRAITSYFYSYNKKRIAMFGANVKSDSDRKKIITMYSCIEKFSKDDVFYNRKHIKECFDEFYERRYEYDAIVCAHDFCAMALIELMNECDPNYFKDRFILGYSNTILSRVYSTPITTVDYLVDDVVNALHSIYLTLRKSSVSKLTLDAKICNYIIPRDSTHNKRIKHEVGERISIYCKGSFEFPMFESDVDFDADPIISKYKKIEMLLSQIDITDLKIIFYILNGLKISEISSKMYITEQTIKVYQRRIFKKACVKNKQELLNLISSCISLYHLEEYIKDYKNN